MDCIRKLERELRETKAVNLQSKQIWMATMKDDVDKVEQLRQEVVKIAQEKKRYAAKVRRGFQRSGAREATDTASSTTTVHAHSRMKTVTKQSVGQMSERE